MSVDILNDKSFDPNTIKPTSDMTPKELLEIADQKSEPPTLAELIEQADLEINHNLWEASQQGRH
jgi:hypothetical protein